MDRCEVRGRAGLEAPARGARCLEGRPTEAPRGGRPPGKRSGLLGDTVGFRATAAGPSHLLLRRPSALRSSAAETRRSCFRLLWSPHSRVTRRNTGAPAARRAPHHGPGRVTGNGRGACHVSCRAAKQPGARDCAPRRQARKPSERSSRPALEGNERVSPERATARRAVRRVSQANGVRARRLREMKESARSARLRAAPLGA